MTVAPITKMIESLPASHQGSVVEYIRDNIEDVRDELHWGRQFENTQEQLASTARQARKQAAKILAEPMNVDEL
jgi:hypothetical protein